MSDRAERPEGSWDEVVKRDEEYWDEVERAVGTGTFSILPGTPARSLCKSLARLRETGERP